MKLSRLATLGLGAVLVLSYAQPANAWWGGYHGGYYWHGGGYGWGPGWWLAPAVVGGVVVGAVAASAASQPPVVVQQPYPVVVQQAAPVQSYAPPVAPAPAPPVEQAPAPKPVSAAPADSQMPQLQPVSTQPMAQDRQAEITRHLQELASADEGVRINSVSQLGRLKAYRAIDPLAATLAGDRSAAVREAAARALAVIGAPKALPALNRAALSDSDHDVRRSAQFAVEVIQSKEGR